MPPVDDIEDALDVTFVVQRRVQRRVPDGRGELAVDEDVWGGVSEGKMEWNQMISYPRNAELDW